MKKFTKKELCIGASALGAAAVVASIFLFTSGQPEETAMKHAPTEHVPATAVYNEKFIFPSDGSQEGQGDGKNGWYAENGFQRYYEDGVSLGNQWVGDYYLNEAHYLTQSAFVVWRGLLYHVDESGKLNRGRFTEGEKEYYAHEDGLVARSDWVMHGDEWIYLDEDGSILKNAVTPDGYLLGADGSIIDDGYAEYEGFQYSDKSLRLNTGAGDLIWKYLKKKGWTDTAIAGLMGNFQQESHLSPSLIESNGIGFGLGQWSFGRRTAMESYAKSLGKPVNDLYMQLDYLTVEPGESRYVKQFMKTNFTSAAEAAIAWCSNWERPNKVKARLASVRIPYAEAYYAHYVDGITYMTAKYSMEDAMYLDDEDVAAESAADEASEYTPLFDENGNPTIGWIFDAGGWWYRYEDGTSPKDEWKNIDSEWYYFGSDGYMESGQWITDKRGKRFQLDEEGHIIPDEETQQETSGVIVAGASKDIKASASDASAAESSAQN